MKMKNMVMTIKDTDIQKIEEFKSLMDRGLRVSGSDVTAVYNSVFSRKMAPTNCATCVKRRISELYRYLKDERKKEDAAAEQGPDAEAPDVHV